MMTEASPCPHCGIDLPADAPEGCCPGCFLKMGLSGGLTSPSNLAPLGDASGISHSAVGALRNSEVGLAKECERGRHLRYFGDYELQEQIAHGGMGVVYRARQVSLNRPVAVKMILSSRLSSPAAIQRFQREAEAAACLDHPHIVPIYEVGEHQGQHYYSMKLIEGEHLGKHVPELARNPKKGAELVATIAHAVHAAHERGILHRDLKPNNILLDADGLPHVADFGLAKRIEEAGGLTQSGMVMGAPNYMSPEQASGRTDAVTVGSDVFSLGIILYEVLTANLPFQAKSGEETLKKVIAEAPKRPGTINDKLDRDLETICLKCLEKEPHHRYASTVALAEDLERWLRGEPIAARPISRSHRIWRWSKRNPVLTALGTAAIGLSITVAGCSNYSINDIQKRQRARVADQLNSLLAVKAAAVPAILAGLAEFPKWANPQLQELADGDLGAEQLWRVRLGLLPSDPQQKPALLARMLEAPPDELLVICSALADQDVSLARLWERAQEDAACPERRIRAASVLAQCDPANPRWEGIAGDVANQLAREDPSLIRDWKRVIEPVGSHLFDPLLAIYQDSKRRQSERISAANILVDFGDQQPNWIIELLKEAEGEPYSVFLAKLRGFPEQQVVDLIRRELARKPEQGWGDPRPEPDWSTPSSGVVQKIEDAQGMLTESFALCQAMPGEQFPDVADELRHSGYRPTRLRPYTIQNDVLIAAIWTRDGRDWKAIHDATPAEVRQRDEQLRQEGFSPADVAAYAAFDHSEVSIERYAALWTARDSSEGDTRLLVDVPDDYTGISNAMRALNYGLVRFQATDGDNGQDRCSSIWREHDPIRHSRRFLSFNDLRTSEDSDVPVLPIDLSSSIRAAEPLHPPFGGVSQSGLSVEAEVVHPMPAGRHLRRCEDISSRGFRPVSIGVRGIPPASGQADGGSDTATAASIWHRQIPSEQEQDDLAKQQANLAVALLKLGRANEVWPLLTHTPAPRLRTYLIHRFAPLAVDPQLLIDRLGKEDDTSARRALILSLGEYEARALPHGVREHLVQPFLEVYQKDPDPGVHSAIEWLLKSWGHGYQLKRIDEQLAGQQAPADGRLWYVNSQKHTMVVLTPDESSGRTFAIATQATTYTQFKSCLSEHYLGYINTLDFDHPDAAMGPLTWYEAVKYCRWLSEQENFPEHEMCYPPIEEIGEGMRLPDNLLERTGYRLATPEEWEYAARAGAETSRYYGHGVDLLPRYAWYSDNAGGRIAPVARLKPNDLGLFDALGNVWEFSHDASPYVWIVGGQFRTRDADTRLDVRGQVTKEPRFTEIGLRVARTMPSSDADTDE